MPCLAGPKPVGDFILHFLEAEGVATQYIPRKKEHRTSAVILGIEPPACNVDCDGNGTVSIGEVQKVINAFLGISNTC